VEILSRGKCRRPCRHIASGKPIGGSSAGLAVLGEFSFSSMIDTIHSPAALADPYGDILLALTELRLKGEDSYGAGFWSGLFGGFLPQPPYFSGGQRRGFTLGLPAHRSFLGTSKFMTEAKKKQKESLISPA
jgi:hypothetical protein